MWIRWKKIVGVSYLLLLMMVVIGAQSYWEGQEPFPSYLIDTGVINREMAELLSIHCGNELWHAENILQNHGSCSVRERSNDNDDLLDGKSSTSKLLDVEYVWHSQVTQILLNCLLEKKLMPPILSARNELNGRYMRYLESLMPCYNSSRGQELIESSREETVQAPANMVVVVAAPATFIAAIVIWCCRCFGFGSDGDKIDEGPLLLSLSNNSAHSQKLITYESSMAEEKLEIPLGTADLAANDMAEKHVQICPAPGIPPLKPPPGRTIPPKSPQAPPPPPPPPTSLPVHPESSSPPPEAPPPHPPPDAPPPHPPPEAPPQPPAMPSSSTQPSVMPPSQHPVMPPYQHPVTPPSQHPEMPPSQHPVTPPSQHPVMPPSQHPAMPPSQHPGMPLPQHSGMPQPQHSVMPPPSLATVPPPPPPPPPPMRHRGLCPPPAGPPPVPLSGPQYCPPEAPSHPPPVHGPQPPGPPPRPGPRPAGAPPPPPSRVKSGAFPLPPSGGGGPPPPGGGAPRPSRIPSVAGYRPPTAPPFFGGGTNKAKLKPFFWDKVSGNPNGAMVWDAIQSGSFQFDEEMIENLFGYIAPNKTTNIKTEPSEAAGPRYIQIIDSKKSQNLSIILKALNVTADEVCDALEEGNELPSELCETLVKMAPTPDEELKLRLYNGDTALLCPADRFLKLLNDIPFAFKRLESLLFMCTLQEETTMLKDTFVILEASCDELRKSRLFLKILEAVLKTGNRMNDGTYRGYAQAIKLDSLLKLSDVKGVDGKTTLLHFVVLEIIRAEGIKAVRAAKEMRRVSSIESVDLVEEPVQHSDEKLRSIGLQVVSGLGNELQHVKKAAVLDLDGLTGTVARIGHRFLKAKEFLDKEMNALEEDSGFHRTLKNFVKDVEDDIKWLVEEEKRIMALIKSTAEFFHGSSGKDEGFRLFGIVRDFLGMIDKVCAEVKNAPILPSGKGPKKEDSGGTSEKGDSVANTKKDLGAIQKKEGSIPKPPDPPRKPSLPDPRQRLSEAIANKREMGGSSSSSSSSSLDDG